MIAVYFKNDYSEISENDFSSNGLFNEFSVNIINKEDKTDFLEKFINNYFLVFTNFNVAKCYSFEKTVNHINNIIKDMIKYNINYVELTTIVSEYELGTIKNTVFSNSKPDVFLCNSKFLLDHKNESENGFENKKRYYSNYHLFI